MLTSICCSQCGSKIADAPSWLELASIPAHAAARAIVYYVQNGGVRYGKCYAPPERTFSALTNGHALPTWFLGEDLNITFKLNQRLAIACSALCTPTSIDRLELRPVFDFFRKFAQTDRQTIVYLLESRYVMGYAQ